MNNHVESTCSKHLNGWTTSAFAVFGLVVMLASAVSTGQGNAGDFGNPGVASPRSPFRGQTYSEWSAAWFRWTMSMPVTHHPLFDTADCSAGQTGNVWFIGGGLGGGRAVNPSCTVPVGTAVFLNITANGPVDNTGCDPTGTVVQPTGFTVDQLRVFANNNLNSFLDSRGMAEIDGVAVQHLSGLDPPYRAQSSVFGYTVPARDNLLIPINGPCYNNPPAPDLTVDEAVADGVYVMIEPLPAGQHTIRFGNPGGNLPLGNVYHITVSNVTLLATIQIPNNPSTNPTNRLQFFDISFLDPKTERYYLADRSNAGVDIIDAHNNVFLQRIGGFTGEAFNDGIPDNDHSGPNGVLVIQPDNQLWAGDGDSTVKVIDLETSKIIDVISTLGSARADEMAYDPADRIVAVANNADDPPFISLISTKPPRRVLSRITFDARLAAGFGAVSFPAGIEQPVWNAHNRRFYVSIPSVQFAAGTKGGVAVIDPRTTKVTRLFSFDDCSPAGLALGPHEQLLVGCGDPSESVIIDSKTGKIVKRFSGESGDAIGGSDEVWFNPGDDHYYLAARNNPGGPVLGIIDATTNTLKAMVPTSPNSHSVAANPVNNRVFVPLTATAPTPCPAGCIGVYGEPDAGD